MKTHFWKMHGAGNDFILADDRARLFPLKDRKWIAHICSRHDGIGAEGLILIQPSKKASFRMRFFNPDGQEAEMCGNGARCAARLAHDLGIAGNKMTIQTNAGILKASLKGNEVRVAMPVPSEIRLNFIVRTAGRRIKCNFINTGVPHVVVETEHLDNLDVQTTGSMLRRHEIFAPKGTNVDFMLVTGNHALRLRTYERGVEAETPACGTGITACALVAALLKKARSPVRVTCGHGDTLTVDFKMRNRKFENVTLSGPAVTVFEGDVRYP